MAISTATATAYTANLTTVHDEGAERIGKRCARYDDVEIGLRGGAGKRRRRERRQRGIARIRRGLEAAGGGLRGLIVVNDGGVVDKFANDFGALGGDKRGVDGVNGGGGAQADRGEDERNGNLAVCADDACRRNVDDRTDVELVEGDSVFPRCAAFRGW